MAQTESADGTILSSSPAENDPSIAAAIEAGGDRCHFSPLGDQSQDQKMGELLKETQQLRQRIDEANCGDAIEELMKKLELVKALEKEQSTLQSLHKQKHSAMQSELLEFEKKMPPVNQSSCEFLDFNQLLIDSSNKLCLAKKELAAKLRANLSLKRQCADVPAQSELIQYERRFSELYAQIQEKHRQTRKHYATYNALLEIKELMLKEISLLNSIDSQFQDAMVTTAGRSKLVDSMEAIVKGSQQKLEKVQISFLAEKKLCDSLKQKHDTVIAEQRHFSSLLKAFQEECTRNERLRRLAV